MKDEDALDFQRFIDELYRETDRGLPLVAAALIDEKLLETLRAFACPSKSADRLLDGPTAPLGSFAARIDACFAFGLIDEFECHEINLIRRVRNIFAHARHGLTFSDERVVGLCASFKADLPEGAGHPVGSARFRFCNATIVLIARLYYRSNYVQRERRESKTWVDPDHFRWRSFSDEPPPEGERILGLAGGTP